MIIGLAEVELLIRGAIVGAAAGLGVALGRADAPWPVKLAGLGLALGVASWAVVSTEGPAPAAFEFGANLTLASLWPFAVLVFGPTRSWMDHPASLLAPFVAVTLIWMVESLPGLPHHAALHWLHRFIEVAVALGTIAAVWRGGGNDLDQARRTLRAPFMGLVGGFVLLLALVGNSDPIGETIAWNLSEAAIGLALTLVGLILFTVPRAGLVARVAPEPAFRLSDPEARLLADIEQAMTEEKAWREEGLTIGKLAARLGVGEHRLRAVVNGRLGHRNFPAFVNGYRLAEAARRLADPAQAGRTVAQIAFACGFASLGPFGRAFKAREGMTPTAYRRQALSKVSSIPRGAADPEPDEGTLEIGETVLSSGGRVG